MLHEHHTVINVRGEAPYHPPTFVQPAPQEPPMTVAIYTLKTVAVLASAFAALGCSHAARASDTISTDRPDFVESSDVVGHGRLQIETGYVSERSSADGIKSRTQTTPTLLRYGISDSLELRIETDGFVRSRSQDLATGTTVRERGFSDLALGVKWHMQDADEKAGTPSVAWLLHVDIDSGSRAFRGQGLRPSLRAVAEWDLPNDFTVGVMPGLFADKNAEGKRFVAGIFAVTLAKELAPRWHGFVELAGQQLAARKNGGSVVTFDSGVAYLVTDTLQLDFSVARGLTSYSPDFQWGVGVSVRF
jgi:Putative MetA-pathway of phenol degradation